MEKNVFLFAYFCYSTGLGPLLLSTLGGAICITQEGPLFTALARNPLELETLLKQVEEHTVGQHFV